jgi:hypothetical protein
MTRTLHLVLVCTQLSASLAAIVPEGELVEIGLQVLGPHGAGMGAEQPAPQKRRRPVAALQGVALAPLLVCTTAWCGRGPRLSLL